MCPACQGSEKGYSVNRSESTLMLVVRKRDEDKTPVMSAIFNRFRANLKKNRNIKADDVNLMSMARSTDFCFKTTYVGMFLSFRSIVRCFQCFVHGLSPFGK